MSYMITNSQSGKGRIYITGKGINKLTMNRLFPHTFEANDNHYRVSNEYWNMIESMAESEDFEDELAMTIGIRSMQDINEDYEDVYFFEYIELWEECWDKEYTRRYGGKEIEVISNMAKKLSEAGIDYKLVGAICIKDNIEETRILTPTSDGKRVQWTGAGWKEAQESVKTLLDRDRELIKGQIKVANRELMLPKNIRKLNDTRRWSFVTTKQGESALYNNGTGEKLPVKSTVQLVVNITLSCNKKYIDNVPELVKKAYAEDKEGRLRKNTEECCDNNVKRRLHIIQRVSNNEVEYTLGDGVKKKEELSKYVRRFYSGSQYIQNIDVLTEALGESKKRDTVKKSKEVKPVEKVQAKAPVKNIPVSSNKKDTGGIRVTNVIKQGSRIVGYECTDGAIKKRLSKEQLSKLIIAKKVSNATQQIYKGTLIIRVK